MSVKQRASRVRSCRREVPGVGDLPAKLSILSSTPCPLQQTGLRLPDIIRHYPALINPTADTAGFSIAFPDFQGCTASGTTVSDAVTNGAEALLEHVEAMEARGV